MTTIWQSEIDCLIEKKEVNTYCAIYSYVLYIYSKVNYSQPVKVLYDTTIYNTILYYPIWYNAPFKCLSVGRHEAFVLLPPRASAARSWLMSADAQTEEGNEGPLERREPSSLCEELGAVRHLWEISLWSDSFHTLAGLMMCLGDFNSPTYQSICAPLPGPRRSRCLRAPQCFDIGFHRRLRMFEKSGGRELFFFPDN